MEPPARSLPLRIGAGYGVAETGIVAVELFIQLYLLKFFTEVVGLRPALAGVALALAVIVDGVTDPVMGAVSDHSRPPGGRRRFFFLIGGLALALCFPLLFHPPLLATQAGKFAFLLGSYTLVNLAMTIIAVPHAALGGELSDDPDVRTQLFGFRLLFGNVGLLLGTLLPGLMLASYTGKDGQAVSRSNAAIVIAVIVFLSALASYLATVGHDRPAAVRDRVAARLFPGTFWRALKGALGNRVFLPLLAAFFVAMIGRTLNSSLALVFYEHRLRLLESDVILYVLGAFILVITVSIPLWVLLARRFGKKWPAFGGTLGLGLLTIIAYPLFPVGGLAGPLVAAVLGGICAGSIVLLDALVADVVDYDTLRSGETREGLYYGLWKMAGKTARAIGLALAGFALSWAGFAGSGASAADGLGERLAFLFGPGVGIFFMAAAGIFAFLPWSRQIHERIRAILRRHPIEGKRG